ncbi:hypothetical protein ACOMHN_018619 [Nucella lapillus]
MATKEAFTTPLTSPMSTEATNNTTTALAPTGTKHWIGPSLWEKALLSLAICSTLETVLILTSNIALLLLIITSPSMRRQMRYHLVLSVVCANLLAGLFSTPFTSDIAIRKDWVHGCYVTVIRALLAEYVQNFASVWGLVLLLLHFMARMLKYEGPAWMVRLPSWLLKALPGLIVASPWIIAVMFQTPVVFVGLHPYTVSRWDADRCPYLLSPWAAYVLSSTCYFIPSVVLVILVVIIIIRFKDSNMASSDQLNRAEMGATLVSAEKEMESRKVHVIVAVVCVLLMGPHHVFYGLRIYREVSWKFSLIGIVFFIILADLLPIVLAIVWLLMLPEVKARWMELVARLPGCAAWCRRNTTPMQISGSTSAAPVSFRNLKNDE